MSKISIAWWNTSLAPLGKSRNSNKEQEIVCQIIDYMTEINRIDFIALGEMSKIDAEYLRKNCKLDDYELKVGVENIGRSSFDTCYLWNSRKLAVTNMTNVVARKGNSQIKIAQKLDVIVNNSTNMFYLFVSHWPSRKWCGEHSGKKHLLGIRLRDEIERLIHQMNSDPHIILLGDYNDEPFAESLCVQVMATRDKSLVFRRKHLLYNPFWESLIEKKTDDFFCGSHYYCNGETTQWYSFDQIIFSHAFIKGEEWKLGESRDTMLHIPGLIQLVKTKRVSFDHLPVFGVIEKVV